MERALEPERSELLPHGTSVTSAIIPTRGKSMDRLTMTTNSIVPEMQSALLASRIDHQEMLEWQEGGGESLDNEPEGEGDAEAPPVEKPPRKFNHPTVCGIDKRPFFPTVLILSLLWSLCMTHLQGMIVTRVFGSLNIMFYFVVIYLITISAALFTSLSNPGLMPEDQFRRLQAGEISLPARSHKHWLYKRPVLRFHQYCRWVTNCIGLKNHRSYMVMLCGFATIAISDAIMDLTLLFANLFGGGVLSELALLTHFLYSVYFAWYATPLLRMHAAFIARNELTQEWKRDEFYIVRDEETGEPIPANDLDTDTYNQYFDANAFEYDPSRNPCDKGWMNNCLVFWLTPRTDEELGEF